MTTNRDYVNDNYWALILMQALLGNISPGIQAVAFRAQGRASLTLHFLVDARTPSIDEDIEEVIGEVEALTVPQEPEQNVVITLEGEPAWPGRDEYVVFLRKGH